MTSWPVWAASSTGLAFPIVDAAGRTSAPGVWAAGNVADPRAQVVTSAGAGSAAAIAINADPAQEDTKRAVDDLDTGGGASSAAMQTRVAELMLGDRRHVL
jgi:hypothetical protein